MKKQARWSLKIMVMILSLGMMATMGLITFVMVLVLRDKQQDLAQNILGSSAQGLAAAVATQFKQRYGDIQTFASNSELLLMNRPSIEEILDKYVELYKIYDVIAMYDVRGELVAANTVGPNGKPLPNPLELKKNQASAVWFNEAKSEKYSDEKSKDLVGTYVEDFQIDPLTSGVYGEPRYGNSFTVGVVNIEGRVVGILTARANFKYIEAEFQNYYQTIKNSGNADVELTLLNSKGEVVVDYDPFSKNGSSSIVRDPEVILNLNLADNGVEAAKNLVEGKSGKGVTTNSRKKVTQFAGYTSLKEYAGFLSSLNWGVLVRSKEESVLGAIYNSVKPFYWGAVLSFFAAAMIGFWWANRMSAQLVGVSGRLKAGVEETYKTSEEMQICSRELAVCSNEQAAAVQETVAAMEEMKSMINQSGEYVSESLQSAKRVSEKTEEGAQTMRQMVDSMEAIQEANGQLQNMANIINEISTKTNVINDIVFKTQLLSFNASIEAARAGQHGRGFAVVAEEVGNLAQMSGAAAKEIKSLLDDSQKQVLQIVDITRVRSTEGQDVSKRAQKTFDEISQEIKTITTQIESVNDAAREQENGVQQTSVSMSKLDESTTRSARMGEQISSAAESLGEQSRRMGQIMKATILIVQGSKGEKEVRKKVDYIEDIIDDREVTPTKSAPVDPDQEIESILAETATRKRPPRVDVRATEDSVKSEKIISMAGKLVDKVKDVEKKLVGTVEGQDAEGSTTEKTDDISADDSSFKKTV